VRRPYIIAAIAAAVVLFLVISALLARVFSANGAEQAAITALVRAEAQGNVNAIVDDISGCRSSPSCRARAASNAASLKRAGAISILQLNPSTSFSVAGTLGTARVAWDAGSSLPITQCVRVRRTGNAISGLRVELLAVTKRLTTDATCPSPSHF
jgi:hypothetical protein